jgi:hypothetical protein
MAFEDHDWACITDESSGGAYWWRVLRDGQFVGRLRATTPFLTADQHYDILNAQGHRVWNAPVNAEGHVTYINALMTLDWWTDGKRFIDGEWK